jgi:hypothetical protein
MGLYAIILYYLYELVLLLFKLSDNRYIELMFLSALLINLFDRLECYMKDKQYNERD